MEGSKSRDCGFNFLKLFNSTIHTKFRWFFIKPRTWGTKFILCEFVSEGFPCFFIERASSSTNSIG